VPLLVRTPLRILLALGAFFVVVTALAACGGDDDNSVPGNAVASVDGTPLTKAEYERWAKISAQGSVAPGQPVVVPDPPNYTRCIAELRRQQRPRRGQPTPSDVTLRAQCRTQNEQLVQSTMSALIQQVWIEKEAEEQGVSVSDAEVRRELETTRRQSFPTQRDYERFLRESGMTQADVEERVRTQALATKLTRKIQDSAAPVTESSIEAYYDRNREQFALPERRDVELILTRTEAQAEEAKQAVESGTSWAAAARRFSIDDASKAAGGRLAGVSEGQQDRAFDRAAFSARRGEIVGPIRGQFGWYVLRVENITAPRQTPLSEARAQIRALLEQQGSQGRLAAFVRDFQRRWREVTNCRAGYIVELCSNAPTPRTTSTSGGTVAPPSDGRDDR
jgi:foldase protein PrsA